MATKKKLLQAAAGSAGGAGLNVEDVFTNWLYTGDDSTTGQTIQNGVDYTDGEERLVWIKARNDAKQSVLVDTVRGVNKNLSTANTTAEDTEDTLSAFTSNGFTVKHTTTGDYAYTVNRGSSPSGATNYASWTFRKAPKFFDVVTYTGNGSTQSISHNLGAVPGCIIVKKTSGIGDWVVYHRGVDSIAPEDYYIELNQNFARSDNVSRWNDTAPTSTQFTVGSAGDTNENSSTYIAYLFAHNDGDGEFGPTGDQDIIKCGSYTGDGAIDGPEVTLGFEPQWLLIKRSDATGDWRLVDVMRGMAGSNSGNQVALKANASEAESAENVLIPTPTGWKVNTNSGIFNAELGNYIYIAIRRGPMAVPESATDVFAIDTEGSSEPYYNSGFPVDFGLQKRHTASGDWYTMSRLTQGKFLETNTTNAEAAEASAFFDYNDGFVSTAAYGSGNSYGWMWRRAPNFCDVVAYTGNDTAGHTISHNLGVAPEMIWVKSRSSALSWFCYHSALTSNGAILLNSNGASFTGTTYWNDTDPTASDFTLGTSINVNGSAKTYIAYLFASLDGVSKVGSYTGNGSTQNIDCGFSSGARFVLIKRTDSTGDWHVWDTERGIVAGFDPYLELNTTNAQSSGATAGDYIDPLSSGFALTSNSLANASGGTYIFYAIA